MAPRSTKECPVCCAEVSSFSVSPATCEEGHKPYQRACSQCWEAFLSKEVEEKAPTELACMFVHDKKTSCGIDKTWLKKLARKDTLIRYEAKLQDSTRFRCQARCAESKSEPHDRKKDGRVFTCKSCASRTCMDCDRPEHDNETCEQYRTRVVNHPKHIRDEAASEKIYERCPNCSCFWEWDPETGKRCGRAKCVSCRFRFCGNCMIPWVGDGSAYLLGRKAHAKSCRYYEMDVESQSSLNNRFEPDDETKTSVEQKKWEKVLRDKAKKKVAEVEGGLEAIAAAEKGVKEGKSKREAAEEENRSGEMDAAEGFGRVIKKQQLAVRSL